MEKINKLKTLRNLSITNLVLVLVSLVLTIFGIVAVFSVAATAKDETSVVGGLIGAGLGILLPNIGISIAIFVIAIVGAVQASKLQKIDQKHKNLFVLWLTLAILIGAIGLLGLIPVVGQFLGFANFVFGIVVYSITISNTTTELKQENK